MVSLLAWKGIVKIRQIQSREGIMAVVEEVFGNPGANMRALHHAISNGLSDGGSSSQPGGGNDVFQE